MVKVGCFLCLMGIFMTGCLKDEKVELYIDDDLQHYFEIFHEEGAKRGVIIDFEAMPVEGYLQDIAEANISGQCQKNENEPNKLIIDTEYWSRISGITREFIVFHELGHCYLKRSHLDEADASGRCISIMHSTSKACVNAYSNSTREAYLDELFSWND